MPEWEIREARESDAAAVVQLTTDANPNMVMTPASWIHRNRTIPARAHSLPLVAEAAGEIVGIARAGLNPNTTVVGAGFGGVIVAAEHRRRGIGTALYERCERHLTELDAKLWTSMLFENEDGLSFARARGFTEERVAFAAAVDPRTIDPRLAPDVEVATAAELGADAVYEIDIAGTLDEPSATPMSATPYDEWRTEIWDEPSFTRDGSFVALADGVPAALSMLYVAPELGRAVNAFTASLPEYRGRGLAFAAKFAAMRWAAENGITRVSTANDDTNAPMLAINAKLGYAPLGRLLTMRRTALS
jgi:GNAT superfamily N-acetyltransferase